MRGDLVTVAVAGDYVKPRPALVIQADAFLGHPSVTLLPITSELTDRSLSRIAISPQPENGLKKPSQVMIDKIQTVRRERIGKRIGRIDDETLLKTTRALAAFLGFA